MTSPRQTSLFTEDASTYSVAASLVSPTAQPESDSARRTLDISGRKCLEQFERFSQDGSWEKTFVGLLVGQKDWYSTRCTLTWKLRDTPLGRSYFQLQASALPTEETESSLFREGMLPTPTARCWNAGTDKERPDGQPSRRSELNHLIAQELSKGMLPTPTAMEYKDAQLTPEQAKDLDKGGRVLRRLGTIGVLEDGKASRLNPLFVEEMMGFPENWTAYPFLNGETNPLKPTGMP
jgi:hypothetical protein